MKQILESGSPATLGLYNASHRESAWENFVSGVPSCTQISASGHTLDCLRHANLSDIAQGLRASVSNSSALLSFNPTLDGPNGFIPDYPSTLLARGQIACVPFIVGTNLDEGEGIAPFFLRLEMYLILSTPQELFSPLRASIQRNNSIISSSQASYHRSLRLRPMMMWHRTSCVSIQIFLPWDPRSAPVTTLLG